MTVDIKGETLYQFRQTKFGKDLNKKEITLISNLYDFLIKEEVQYGPKCIACGRKDLLDEFLSSDWMAIDTNKLPGPINLIWVCPDCIGNTRVAQELEMTIEELREPKG